MRAYSYTRDREETIARLTLEGLDMATIRRVFRLSQTLHRLAVASCNGDWPADNGERKTTICPRCEGGWHPSSFKRSTRNRPAICPDCYAEEQVRALFAKVNTAKGLDADTGYRAVMQGDPRGCVVKVAVPSGYTNDGGREGICIPVRER